MNKKVLIHIMLIFFIFQTESTYSQSSWNSYCDYSFNSTMSFNGMVNVIVGDEKSLYIGGNFTTVQKDTAFRYITRYENKNWYTVGYHGAAKLIVTDICLNGNDVYLAGGYFCKYDGKRLSDRNFGQYINGATICIAKKDSDIIIGGDFSLINNIPYRNIARFSNNYFYPIGGGLYFQGRMPTVNAIAVVNDDIYFGGNITYTSDFQTANGIAKWDGNSWSTLGTGLTGVSMVKVYSIKYIDSQLYVGGDFKYTGGKEANFIARWDGKDWYPLGTGTNGVVKTIEKINDKIFVGGEFTTAGGKEAKCVALWDGIDWYPFGSEVGIMNIPDKPIVSGNPSVNTIYNSGEFIYLGGNFNAAGGKEAYYMARWKFPTIGVESIKLPNEFKLNQNYPNPFNSSTIISYQLSENGNIKLRVFDVLGRLIKILVNEYKTAGEYKVNFDGSNLPSGVYYYSLSSNKYVDVRKMILMK